jgi:hypothetical protein
MKELDKIKNNVIKLNKEYEKSAIDDYSKTEFSKRIVKLKESGNIPEELIEFLMDYIDKADTNLENLHSIGCEITRENINFINRLLFVLEHINRWSSEKIKAYGFMLLVVGGLVLGFTNPNLIVDIIKAIRGQ